MSTLIFILRRVAWSVVVLFAVLVVIFLVSSVVGDPARLRLPENATEEQVAQLRHQLGLDRPLYVQFFDALSGWIRGDFGQSYSTGTTALDATLGHLPATLALTALTILVSVPLAVALGSVAARWRDAFADRVIGVLALAGVSVADFWLGLMLIVTFAVTLHVLPTSGYGGLAYFVLPVATLAVRLVGRLTLVVRANLTGELTTGYARTARSKGLTDGRVLVRHVYRNAAIPIITVVGAEMVSLLNGAVVVENVFGWPGIGSLLVGAIRARDFPLIQSTVAVVAVLVLVINIVIDASYSFIDRRVVR